MSAATDPGTINRGTPSQPGLWRRLRRRPVAVGCLVVLVLLVLVAVVAPMLLPDVASQRSGDLDAVNQGPSLAHPLGTDTVGRDVAHRLLVGTRFTLVGMVEALAVVLLLGVPGGMFAGYFGGVTDRVVNFLADLAFSIPSIVIVIVVLAVFPQSLLAAMVTLGVLAAPGLMRLVRSATLPVREELYVAAAQVAGLSRRYILARHVAPRIVGPVIVQASLLAAVALLVQTGLAFLGLLAPEPTPSWGGMVANGLQVITSNPWLIWPPGVAIAVTVLALGLLGDAVRDETVEAWAGTSGAALKGHRRQGRHIARTPSTAERAAGRLKRAKHEASTSDPVPATCMTPETPALLTVSDLGVSFATNGRVVDVVDGVSFHVQPGECLGVVGESGCGKSITGAAVLGLLPPDAFVSRGSIHFAGRDLSALSDEDLQRLRGKSIAFVSQEPMIGLDPAFRIDAQLGEVVRLHSPTLSKKQVEARVLKLLRDVRLSNPEDVAKKYPHQLSGGMAQRVCIARALAGDPGLLIADEPTTALDVTVQAEILDLFRVLRREHNMAIVIITHDWGVIAQLCDRAIVMYGGQIVESARIVDLFQTAAHPYTKALMASNPHGAPAGTDLPTIRGSVPPPGSWPDGCRFRERCKFASEVCEHGHVELVMPAPGRESRCRRVHEVTSC